MAYSEALAQRIREVFDGQPQVAEKKMFGGLSFMVRGNMCCGVLNETLVVRVGPENYEGAVTQPHARPMDFTGRTMKGMVYVEQDGFASDEALREWINRGMKFVDTLPSK